MGVNTPGVNIFAGAPPLVHPASTGRVFYVGSVAVPGGVVGADVAGAHGDSPQRPFATVDYAVGQCTAGRGDVIYVLPGYTETLSAAAAWDLDVSGISVIGLGDGRLRPTITVATAVGTDIDIDAANITVENIFFDLTALDAVTAFIDVNAADFTLKGCEILQGDADGQATRCVVGATAADRMKILHNVFRSTTAGAASAINLVGTADDTEIAYNRIYGDFSVAAIENATANVCTNLHIHHNYIQNDNNGNWAIELVSACTGVIEYNTLVTDAIATAVDWGSCAAFDNWYADDGSTDTAGTPIPITVTTGGVNLDTLDDKLGTEAATDPISEILSGTGGITTWKTGAVPATGVSISEALRYYGEQIINGTGTALPSNASLFGMLGGASGVVTWDAAAAPANGVSIAEAIRYLSEYQLPRIASKAVAAWGTSFTTGASPVTLFTVTGNVKARVFMVQTTAATSTGTTGTIAIGVTGNTGGLLAAVTANGTNFPTNSVWAGDTSPTLLGEALSGSSDTWFLIGNGSDIIATIATNDMTAGASTFYCEYIPLDSSASVVAA